MMSKVTINGEVFAWDPSLSPLSEALAIENALHMRFDDWNAELRAGSAHALAGFIWLVWRRNGRDVAWADIEQGKVEVEMSTYKLEPDDGDAAEDDPRGPTTPGPEATNTTGAATSSRSSGSASSRGKSAT
jgi:hypothetical protein